MSDKLVGGLNLDDFSVQAKQIADEVDREVIKDIVTGPKIKNVINMTIEEWNERFEHLDDLDEIGAELRRFIDDKILEDLRNFPDVAEKD